ncbi:hypothetical protein RclHR1_34910001 [Rhizophagus clarus]|uniref:DDE-1 domain-containing protein n=1 Tax=Rhizophagus clarus TaxID=94130 RepID=A0A2Z6RAH0_9GLOM|nr:hypothetical protein RclHR1_18280003 [Rhizophagus clarus]GBB99335.1 hypothetical protein RclHR1_34910001 [Rhizophagus clarus]GES94651.1 hypothetical protein RCL_jg6416.t1 [Rhizophagus clarus]
MTNGSAGLTAGGNLKRVRLSDVYGWVKLSWENISNEIITQSFKTCEIINDINETFIKNKDFEVTNDNDSDSKKNDDQESIYMKFPQVR